MSTGLAWPCCLTLLMRTECLAIACAICTAYLPHETSEARLDLRLALQRADHLLLAHVHLQAALDEVLHELNV